MAEDRTVALYDDNKEHPVATITLNGYNISAGGVFGTSGAMRSFKLEKGELYNYWMLQTPLHIRDEEGTEARIRIFAAPVDKDGSGFVEFL